MRTSKFIGAPRAPGRVDSISWLFRHNLPPRRMPSEQPRRNIFNIGEIVGVIANPGETVRSLTDARRSLEEARNEIKESRERAQLRTRHTFSPLPGFFSRQAELNAVENALKGAPSFTVLFGASSVGKTALLREVLSRDAYHVLHFDLRIAGFADLTSLYTSLSQQMEQYFDVLSKEPGFEEFEKDGWAFKHDRLDTERRIESGGKKIKTSDVARLMELFQSSLLHYWEFEPSLPEEHPEEDKQQPKKFRKWSTKKADPPGTNGHSRSSMDHSEAHTSQLNGVPNGVLPNCERKRPPKKMPVIFFDEAHRLPALIHSTETMKCLLDSMIVLTKQDRLCHVIHATSDSFYQTWLRKWNIMQHCKIIAIGDCSKRETQVYFEQNLLQIVPHHLRAGLNFDRLFDAFGGKLAHWSDFVSDYVNSDGRLTVKKSSHFLQAHALLNLHVIHASEPSRPKSTAFSQSGSESKPKAFKIYSPVESTGPGLTPANSGQNSSEGNANASFTEIQLLRVMRKLAEPGTTSLPYFLLTREFGIQAVDDMVRGKILELRWMDPVTPQGEHHEDENMDGYFDVRHSIVAAQRDSMHSGTDTRVSFTAPNLRRLSDVLGPKLYPISPIVRCAMSEVVKEYEHVLEMADANEGVGSDKPAPGSEYASLSEAVDEY